MLVGGIVIDDDGLLGQILDGLDVVDRKPSAEDYDADDFALGANYYAVWTINKKVVLTQMLDLTSAATVNKLSDYGYSWDLETGTLVLDGFNVCAVSDYCLKLPNNSIIVLNKDSINSINPFNSFNTAISCENIEIKNSNEGGGSLNLSGLESIRSSGNVTLSGGTITLTTILSSGKVVVSGGNVVASANISKAVTASAGFEMTNGSIEISSVQENAIYVVSGNVLISGGSVKVSSGYKSAILIDSVCWKCWTKSACSTSVPWFWV